MYIFAPGLDIEKRTKSIALINIAAAVINVAMNLLLIPHMGILGSALATLISAVFMLTTYIHMSQRLYPIPFRWDVIGSTGLVTAVIMMTAFFIPDAAKADDGLFIAGKLLLLVMGSLWAGRRLLKGMTKRRED
jgi:O-antigen/teichoic acid export membrane protein